MLLMQKNKHAFEMLKYPNTKHFTKNDNIEQTEGCKKWIENTLHNTLINISTNYDGKSPAISLFGYTIDVSISMQNNININKTHSDFANMEGKYVRSPMSIPGPTVTKTNAYTLYTHIEDISTNSKKSKNHMVRSLLITPKNSYTFLMILFKHSNKEDFPDSNYFQPCKLSFKVPTINEVLIFFLCFFVF